RVHGIAAAAALAYTRVWALLTGCSVAARHGRGRWPLVATSTARARRRRWLVSPGETILVVVVALLIAVIVCAFMWLGRLLGRMGGMGPAAAGFRQRVDDAAYLAEKDQQEQSLAALREAAETATVAVEQARAAASAARSEAVAAKAEASAARAEAQRIVGAAH